MMRRMHAIIASLRADRIHPNADGYRALALGFADALAEAGFLTR